MSGSILENKLHIAVLMGGWANERDVSLSSGEGIANALEERGHTVTRIDMDRQVAARIAQAAPDVFSTRCTAFRAKTALCKA